MALTVTPQIVSYLKSLKGPEVGLIVGLPGLALHLAPTQFAPDEDDDEKENKESGPRLSTLRTSLLTHHTRQILRMLPGGLVLHGVYAADNGKELDEKVAAALVTSLEKNLATKFVSYYPKGEGQGPLISLLWDQGKSVFVPEKSTKVATSSDSEKLVCARTDFFTSRVLVQQQQGPEEKSLKETMEKVVKGWEEKMKTAIFLFDGEKAGEGKVFKEGSQVSVIIDSLPSALLPRESDKEKELGVRSNLTLKGKVHLIGFARQGASQEEIAKALKTDLLRGLSSRLQMHCESLVDEDMADTGGISGRGEAPAIFHEIPRRVFVHLEGKGFGLVDYLFPGEGPRDCVQSFKDVLGVDGVAESEIEMVEGDEADIESILQKGSSMEELFSKAEESISQLPGMSRSSVLLAVVVAFFAFLAAISLGVYFRK